MMAVWLLTWNPDKWNWDNYDEECAGLSEDYPYNVVVVPKQKSTDRR